MQNSKRSKYFNGYVRNPRIIVFMTAIVGIFAFSIAILCTFLLIVQSGSVDLQQITTQINQIEEKETVIYLHTDMGVFSIPDELLHDNAELENCVENKKYFSIQYKPLSKNSEIQGSVWELVDSDGMRYLDAETTREYRQDNYWHMTSIAWILVGVYTLITWGIWYCLSHAPKYPHLAALLVRKQWRNF